MKKIVFLLLTFLISINVVMADSFGVFVAIDKKEVAPGDTVRASIMLTCLDNEWEGSSFKIGLDFDSELFTIDQTSYRVRDGWNFEPVGGSNSKFLGTIEPTIDPWDTFNGSETNIVTGECYTSGISLIDNIKLKVNDNIKNQNTKLYSVLDDDKDGFALVSIYSKSNDNSLSSLSVEGFDLLFKKDVTTYDLSVPFKTETITLKYACSGAGCSVTNNGELTEILEVGKNTIDIEVKAEDGSKKKYTVNVERQTPNNSSVLSSLELTNNKEEKIDIKFNKDIFTYNIEVPYEVTYVNALAKCEEEGCSVKYSNVNLLKVGNNTFNINVTAESGDVSKYIINISRDEKIKPNIIDNNENEEEIEKPESNNTLVIILSIICALLFMWVIVLIWLLQKKDNESVINKEE